MNCEKLFGHQDLVPNPLVLAGAQDWTARPASAGEAACDKALDKLEGLSSRVWHMATRIDPFLLEARLMLQPDAGMSDLQAIFDCRSLYSSRAAQAVPSQDVCTPDGVSGTNVQI